MTIALRFRNGAMRVEAVAEEGNTVACECRPGIVMLHFADLDLQLPTELARDIAYELKRLVKINRQTSGGAVR